MNEIVLNKQYFELKPTGLIVNGKPTFENYKLAMGTLRYIEGSIQWWLGDLLNAAEKDYGEMYSQLVDETDYTSGTLRNSKWVSGVFELSSRDDNLTFNHHRVIAPLMVKNREIGLQMLRKVANEKLSVRQTEQAAKGKQRMLTVSNSIELPLNIDIIHGTIEEDGKQIANNSVDLIFTDPPYGEEFLPLWDELAKFAYRTLKPSGYLITYSGQFHLPTVMSKLSKTLDYYWTFSLNHSGNKQLINPRQLFCGWKPIIVFAKPPLTATETRIDDVIIGSGREKALHEWQQALEEVKPLIETFSPEGGLVVDPFCGSGTIPLAAYKLNRRAIGIEKELDNINIAKGRIADAN